MCKATYEGKKHFGQIGYLPKEIAKELKNQKGLKAMPHSAFIPYQGKSLGLKIRILGK